ncbi:MAG TPA: hypothetical protein VGA84_07840 [Thermoanaerobaculia bacterium]
MRRLVLALALLLAASTASSTKPVDFETQIQPILKGKCQPCHFPGGTMYAKRPFDKASTIVALGEKLFTRIKDEKERALIRAFLAEQESQQSSPAR